MGAVKHVGGVYNTHLQWGKLSCLSCKAAPAGCVKYSISNWISRFTKGTVLTKAVCILVRFPGHLPAPSWCRFSILLRSHLKGWRQNVSNLHQKWKVVCCRHPPTCLTTPVNLQREPQHSCIAGSMWHAPHAYTILSMTKNCSSPFSQWFPHVPVPHGCFFGYLALSLLSTYVLSRVQHNHDTILYIPIGANIAMCVPLFYAGSRYRA